MTDRYAVIGNPIAHSRSPQIHSAFAKQTGEDLEYHRILGAQERIEEQIHGFFAEGGKGMNITVPFKEDAWRLADERSPRARSAGAANTRVLLPDRRLRADNTDGIGLVRDLTENHGVAIRNRRILLLGAGGASRGVARPLLDELPAQLLIANRTATKAIDLARELADLGPVRGCGLEELSGQRFDLIVNGTAAGLAGHIPEIPDDCLIPGGITYDMMYSDKPTAFVRWGLEHEATLALDGLGMLVEQAAESFFLWRGVRPETREVIRSLTPI